MYSYADGHCDTIVKIYNEKEQLKKNNKHLDLERIGNFEHTLQFFAVWLHPQYYPIALRQTLAYIQFYFDQLAANADHISHVFSYADILKNQKKGKISAILAIEGGEALEGEITTLQILYRLGVRAMTLTWNHRNALADGVGEDITGGGLTHFGRKAVAEMNRLGMVVDVSHLNEAGFWDVDKIAEAPYIASHSNAKAICNVPRNLSDQQLKAIADKGGVSGLNFYPSFLTENGKASIRNVMEHIDYIMHLTGEDFISLGGDFDGIDSTPEGLSDSSYIVELFHRIERTYGRRVADKISHENLLRVLKNVLQ